MGQKINRIRSAWLHLWRRVFAVDPRGRGFWRKFIFRFRTVLLLLFIYLAFFVKRHLLDLVPYLSSGMVRLGDFYSNYTDELRFRRVNVQKSKKGRYKIRLSLPKIRAQFGRQPKGDKLIAVQEVVVEGGSVYVETWGRESNNPQRKAFAFLIKRLAMVRRLLWMPDIRYHLKNIDVHIVHHGKSDTDLRFGQVEMQGSLKADRQSFCTSLDQGRASLRGHRYGFSTDSCFYADYIDFGNIRLFPLSSPQERIKGHLTLYPDLYGDPKGKLELQTDFFRLARRPYKVNLPPLRRVGLVYSFFDNVDEIKARARIAGSGSVRAYYREEDLSTSNNGAKEINKKSKIRWNTSGLNKATVNRLLQGEGIAIPSWLRLGEIRASGIHYQHARGFYGSARIKSSIREPWMGKDFDLDGNLSYGNDYLKVRELSLKTKSISLVGVGRVSRAGGWDLSFALTTGGMNQIQSPQGDKNYFVDLDGYSTVTGALSFPKIQTALSARRLTEIQYSRQKASKQGSKDKLPTSAGLPTMEQNGKGKDRVLNLLRGAEGIGDGDQPSRISLLQSGSQEREKKETTFYYHRLDFTGRLAVSQRGKSSFSGELEGYPSRSSLQRNTPFWLSWRALWRGGKSMTDFELSGRLGNLRLGDYSVNAKLAGSVASPLRVSLKDIELWRKNQLIIADGDVQFARGNRWRYNFELTTGDLFSMRGEGYLPSREEGAFTWELAAMGEISNLAFLNKWGFDFDHYRGGIHYSLIWRKGRRERLQLRVNSDRLYWLGGDDPERYLSFTWRLFQGERLSHSLTINENSGWFANKIEIREMQQDPAEQKPLAGVSINWGPLAQRFSHNPVTFELQAKNFSLDVFNPFWRSLNYKVTIRQGLLDGRLRGSGRPRRMSYEAGLTLRAKELLWGYNKLTDISLSLGMGEKDYRNALFSFANFKGYKGRIKTEAIFYLRDLLAIRYSINILVNDLRYYLDNKDYITLDMRSHLQYRSDQYSLKGNLVLHDGKIFFDEMDLLKRRKASSRMNLGSLDQKKIHTLIPANWTVGLNIRLADNLWIKSGLAHLELTGGADFRFADNEASLNGRIDIKRGTLFIQNNNFEIQPESHVIIAGFKPKNYQMDLEAVTEIPGGISQQQALFFENTSSQAFTTLSNQQYYDVYLFLRGNLLQPVLSFRSTPPLPRNRILAGIAMGQIVSNDDAAIDLMQQSSAAAINIFTSQLNTLVEQRTGVDTFKVQLKEPADTPQGETMSTDVSFTVGQYLTKRMFIKYRQQLIQEERPFLVTMEYNITEWLKFVVSGGTNEKRGQDLYSGLLFINFNY